MFSHESCAEKYTVNVKMCFFSFFFPKIQKLPKVKYWYIPLWLCWFMPHLTSSSDMMFPSVWMVTLGDTVRQMKWFICVVWVWKLSQMVYGQLHLPVYWPMQKSKQIEKELCFTCCKKAVRYRRKFVRKRGGIIYFLNPSVCKDRFLTFLCNKN